MQSLKKIHAWAQMQDPLSRFCCYDLGDSAIKARMRNRHNDNLHLFFKVGGITMAYPEC